MTSRNIHDPFLQTEWTQSPELFLFLTDINSSETEWTPLTDLSRPLLFPSKTGRTGSGRADWTRGARVVRRRRRRLVV